MTDLDELWDERHEVEYLVELSRLYHQKRERFFELCDKLSKAASLIGGSAALWKIGNADLVAIFSLMVAFSSAFSLVFSFSERSKRHAELARNFQQFRSVISAKSARNFTEEDILQWRSELHRLETTEPAALTALVILCQNEMAIAANQKNKVVKLKLRERLLCQFFDFSSAGHVS